MHPSDGQPSSQQAIARLLHAWRGEIQARAAYEVLAARERDPKRAEILRRMADAEGGHRARIEARLQELGATVPDPASVHLPFWSRLQIRLAPVEKVLAWRESLEDEEVEGVYGTPTGDTGTDELLTQLRKEERSHALADQDMRSGAPAAVGAETPEGRLRRILGRERWHQTGSSWISGAVYGANDGLGAVFGIVAGVSGATGGSSFVLTAGLAGAIASALSMAVGAFLAERSAAEVAAANVEAERKEVAENPKEEQEELSLFYQLKGLDRTQADELATRLSGNAETFLQALVTEELGGMNTAGNPFQAGIAAGLSTAVGAFIPVVPFFWLSGTTAVIWATVVSMVAHFLVGAAKSLFTLRSWWASGLEMTAAGIIVGGATYGLGVLFRVAT
ncbi:MAG TPA: VIT1/CCC1 transporter family protein [bacterium]|nr:VIT1/CCC1 transporter family protein [bacterium]